jgi:hypothetical protein
METFFLLSSVVVVHEVLIRPEDVSGLHSSAPLRTQNALHHNASAKVKSPTIVTDPIIVRYFINTITSLMHWNVASSTKDNQILVLVISIVTDSALGVLLNDKTSLVGTERVVSLYI